MLDERGVPEAPRTESGHAVAPAAGRTQDNLITDLGLDQITEFDCFAFNTNPTTWRRYLAVGTGSVAPAAADTALAAEAQRANSSGAFSLGATTYELDTGDDVWRATSVVTRVVTMTADRNIAEFGFSPASSGAIGIRELLRDGGGNPVPVTLLAGKTLRVDHTLTVELPAPAAGIPVTIAVDEYDAGNNLVNSAPYDVVHGGYYQGSPTATRLESLFRTWNPYVTGLNVYHDSTDVAYSRSATSVGVQATTSVATYASGSRQRIKRGTFAAGSANGSIYGYRFRQGTEVQDAINGGWRVVFTNPNSYVKADTDTVRVGIISSWARA